MTVNGIDNIYELKDRIEELEAECKDLKNTIVLHENTIESSAKLFNSLKENCDKMLELQNNIIESLRAQLEIAKQNQNTMGKLLWK